MAIERGALVERLGNLERAAARAAAGERSLFVTFDDGWSDPADLVAVFDDYPHLQPVLFLTSAQLLGDEALLPLPRLYEWCAAQGLTQADLSSAGVTRKDLKRLPELAQHAALDRLGIPRIARPGDTMPVGQVRALVRAGWLVGSHGHDHHDLRVEDPLELLRGLQGALETVVAFGGKPWLAWPEGRCTERTCEIAQKAGFEMQFSLRVEAGGLTRSDLVHREIWR